MKKVLLLFLLLFAATAMNAQTIVMGDMNDDKDLTIADAVSVVDVILGKSPKREISLVGDPYLVDNTLVVGTWRSSGGTSFTLSEDGTTSYFGAATYKFRPYQGTLTLYDASQEPFKAINVNNLTSSYLTIVENGTFTKFTKSDGHDYVDLGLPSGTLWATCNVGASSPEDYGDYFAWGETSTKTTFYNYSYFDTNDDGSTFNKYNSGGLTELELEDDAAYVNWGPTWCTPSKEQFVELINSSYTTTEWITTESGVSGWKITSKTNGNFIFLPAAGYHNSSLNGLGSNGAYWSRALDESDSKFAWCMDFSSSWVTESRYWRFYGQSVRPVRYSK